MHICGLVTLAEQREANGSKLPAGEGRGTAWVTARAMEDWLVEVGFLEELFGSSMHVELVSAVVHRLSHVKPSSGKAMCRLASNLSVALASKLLVHTAGGGPAPAS